MRAPLGEQSLCPIAMQSCSLAAITPVCALRLSNHIDMLLHMRISGSSSSCRAWPG